MQNMGIVIGDEEQAKELIVGVDTVYVHKNIKKIEEGVYEYEEIQYNKNEYIEVIANSNKAIGKQLTETQLALTELYEMKGVE